jgi:hypothetical protein
LDELTKQDLTDFVVFQEKQKPADRTIDIRHIFRFADSLQCLAFSVTSRPRSVFAKFDMSVSHRATAFYAYAARLHRRDEGG